MENYTTDKQYRKFCAYGFLKNLRFFDPFIILFFRETGISYFQIGTLIAIRAIAVNLLEIPSGIIADSVGRRRSMIFSFASYILAFLMFFFFNSYTLFIPAMLLYAFGEAFRTGTHKAMILEYLRRNNQLEYKVPYYGHTRSWSQKGSALSSLIAGVIVFTTSNYHAVFIFSVIPYILELFLMMSYPSYLDYTGGEKERESITIREKVSITLKGLLSVIRQPDSRRTLINSSIFDGMFKSLKDYIQPLLKSFIVTIPLFTAYSATRRIAVLSALVYFVLYMLTSTASKNSGRIAGLFRSHEKGLNIYYLFAAFIAFVTGCLVWTGFYIPAVILFIMYYVLQNLRRPVMTGILSGKIPHEAMATGLSVESQGKTLFTTIIAPVAGFLVDKFGLGAAMMILAFLLIVVYPFLKFKTPAE